MCENNSQKRPAGNFFIWNDKLIRPAQDCSQSYGCALNFYEVNEVAKEKYEELLLKKVLPEKINSNMKGTPQGIHTYNHNNSYEVVDLKDYEVDVLYYITRPIWYIWRRLRRFLVKNG